MHMFLHLFTLLPVTDSEPYVGIVLWCIVLARVNSRKESLTLIYCIKNEPV